jgi:alkylation response protein AidB-like acyl-CoA dehydrogenase
VDFGFTPQQEQLRAQVRKFLDAQCPIPRVRRAIETPAAAITYDRALWASTAALGWPALVVPESNGGLALSWEDVVVVAEESGRSLFPSPLLATTTAARLLARLGNEEQKSRWLPAVASGECVATLAVAEANDLPYDAGIELAPVRRGSCVELSGTKTFVAEGADADLLLVAVREGDDVGVYAVTSNAAGLVREPLRLLDATQRTARIAFDHVALDPAARLGGGGDARAALRDALDADTVARAAEMVGSAQAALDLAVEYAKVRKQFGQPIGRFQAVKHRLAEIHVAVESARSLVYYASWAVDNTADATRHVSMARNLASEAVDRAGEECVQTHGAIGFTAECDAQLFYKRGRFSRNFAGTSVWHDERILASLGA